PAALPQIECIKIALSDENSTGTLHHGADTWAQHSLFQSGMAGEYSETVPVRRASEMVRDELNIEHISILKIDAEGVEARILRDLFTSEGKRIAIDAIQLEYHSDEDRVAIDRTLSADYFLAFANSTKIHRGRLSYVRKSLI